MTTSDRYSSAGAARRVVCGLLLIAFRLHAQPPLPDAQRVGLYNTVAAVLTARWPDPVKGRFIVAPLIDEHRPRADSARTFGEEVDAVWALLEKIPSSHLGLTSATASRSLTAALSGVREPMFGFQLMRWEGRWYATTVLDGGPAQRAGIRNWDEVLLIDGVAPASSPRLDYRTDDAYLGDDRDPPVHPLVASSVAMAQFTVRTATDSVRVIDLQAEMYSALEASQASVDVIQEDSLRVGYVHLWYMHTKGVAGWFSDLFDVQFQEIDALVFDARGRGGSGWLPATIADVIGGGRSARFRGPVVVLQDRQTRSAKEMLIDLVRRRGLGRLVGEPTAGAVVPSSSVSLGHGLTLMMPTGGNTALMDSLELHPVAPDVAVRWGGPLSGGRDPILAAGFREAKRLVQTQGRGSVLQASPANDGTTRVLRPE
jgi:carboxyl-terminal processing protease